MIQYNWQKPDWPHFQYDLSSLQETLFLIFQKTGLISGKLSCLPQNLQMEAVITFLIEEAIKTSEIEGEYISRPDVRSSIQHQLGLTQQAAPIHDQRAKSVVEMMLDVRRTFNEPLSDLKLFEWHHLLLTNSFNKNLKIGGWRTHQEPMHIVSEYEGKRVVQYEAPPSQSVPQEMQQFTTWFNETAPGKSNAIIFPSVRAAIAHLYFESIHPFEDGNGRIGRAIAEKALSQGLGSPILLSLSRVIDANKKSYYAALKAASQSNEITAWIHYFVDVILAAQVDVEQEINFILKKSAFFDRYKDNLNERHLKVIKRMMKTGAKGFEDGMSAKKYITIAKTSKATATRDLQNLLKMQVIKRIGSGRSVRYELNLDDP